MATFVSPEEVTPSQRDGYSVGEEKKRRRQTCHYISECGIAMKLPKLAVMTSQHFFHKFYGSESFKRHDRFHVAMACLFLAGKVEEAPARLGKIVQTCEGVRWPKRPPLDVESAEFLETKHEVLVKERAVLYAIGFDVNVENPILHYAFLVKQLKACGALAEADEQQFSQLGINFVGDSYRTNLCLQQPPQKIASACAFLTVIFMRKLPADKSKLNRMFATLSISERSLKSICSQMVELYADNDKCATLIRDLAHMGHLHTQLLRDLRLEGPPPRSRAHSPGPQATNATPPA